MFDRLPFQLRKPHTHYAKLHAAPRSTSHRVYYGGVLIKSLRDPDFVAASCFKRKIDGDRAAVQQFSIGGECDARLDAVAARGVYFRCGRTSIAAR